MCSIPQTPNKNPGTKKAETVSQVSYNHLAGLRNSEQRKYQGQGDQGMQKVPNHGTIIKSNSAQMFHDQTLGQRTNSLKVIP